MNVYAVIAEMLNESLFDNLIKYLPEDEPLINLGVDSLNIMYVIAVI